MDENATLAFAVFWEWLITHPNCILRAGTPEAVIFDDDDLHWHFATAVEDGTPVVQVLRGKRLLGELLLIPEQGALARIIHQLSAAGSDAPHPAALSHLGVLDVLSSTPPRPSDRNHHCARHLATLAAKPGE
jgi:hypothetical protein